MIGRGYGAYRTVAGSVRSDRWLLARSCQSHRDRSLPSQPPHVSGHEACAGGVCRSLPPSTKSFRDPGSVALPPAPCVVLLVQLVVGGKQKEAGTPTSKPLGLGSDRHHVHSHVTRGACPGATLDVGLRDEVPSLPSSRPPVTAPLREGRTAVSQHLQETHAKRRLPGPGQLSVCRSSCGDSAGRP